MKEWWSSSWRLLWILIIPSRAFTKSLNWIIGLVIKLVDGSSESSRIPKDIGLSVDFNSYSLRVSSSVKIIVYAGIEYCKSGVWAFSEPPLVACLKKKQYSNDFNIMK